MLEPQGFELRWTPAAIQYLAKVGYDPEFGARPVKRAIQDYVLNDLSKKILAEEVSRENQLPSIIQMQMDWSSKPIISADNQSAENGLKHKIKGDRFRDSHLFYYYTLFSINTLHLDRQSAIR